MLTRQFADALNETLGTINEASTVRTVSTMALKHRSILEPLFIDVLSTTDHKAAPYLGEARKAVTAATKELRQVRAGNVFVELERLRSRIRFPPPDRTEVSAEYIQSAADNLYTAYEKFVSDYSARSSVLLVVAGAQYETAVQTFERHAELALSALHVDSTGQADGPGSLDLVLWTPDELHVVVAKLDAIVRLYRESANIFGVSYADAPLRIARLEGGSLWAKVVGETRVIAFITDLIERGVNYLHRNFTNEGRVAAMPRRVEAVNAVLDLSERLREAGIDTTGMDANLQASGVVLSQQLTTLLGGEATVEINGRLFALAPTLRGKYIAGERRALGSGNSDIDEEGPGRVV